VGELDWIVIATEELKNATGPGNSADSFTVERAAAEKDIAGKLHLLFGLPLLSVADHYFFFRTDEGQVRDCYPATVETGEDRLANLVFASGGYCQCIPVSQIHYEGNLAGRIEVQASFRQRRQSDGARLTIDPMEEEQEEQELPAEEEDTPRLKKVQEDLLDLQKEYAAYRQRARRETRRAEDRARAEVARSLVGLVDDCDRALEVITDPDVVAGLTALRDRSLERFQAIGLIPFAEPGDKFDVESHEAIATEPGEESQVLARIHSRGWRTLNGKVVRVATVTVAIEEKCHNGSKGCVDNQCVACQFESEIDAL